MREQYEWLVVAAQEEQISEGRSTIPQHALTACFAAAGKKSLFA